jgi:hypothetical protein
MASVGLTVHRSPFLGLADTLSQAFTGDAETKAKLALTSSQIWNNEYQNRLYQAQAAQEAQKTADLQKLAEERAAAQPGIVRGYGGAVPAPVDQPAPVEISRIAGPVNGVPVSAPPSIVDMNYYNDQKAAAEARGRLAPYLAKDATDLSSAYFRDVGGSSLASGLTPGGPAAVGRTPDQMRLASTLYTGNAPTATTMMTSGDTAPALNATREAAGKLPYDVALEQAKAEAKAQADAAANPAGTAGAGPAAAHLAALKAKPPGSLTPEEQQLIPLLQSIVDKELSIALPEKSTLQTFGPDGVKQTAGPSAAAAGSIYNRGSGDPAIERGHLDTVSAAMASDPNWRPTRQEYADYETAYNNQMLVPKAVDTGKKNPDGTPAFALAQPVKPESMYFPDQVKARMLGLPDPRAIPTTVPAVVTPPAPAGVTPPTPAVPAAAAPAAGAPAVAMGPNGPLPTVVEQPLPGTPPEYVGSQGQMADRMILSNIAIALAHIKSFPPQDLPSAFWQVWANPSSDPSTLETTIEQMAPGPARRYAQMLNQYALNLYRLSGAAFPGGERPQNIRTFIPSLADIQDPQTYANKIEAATNEVQGIMWNAYVGDPTRRHLFQQQMADPRYSLKLDDNPVAPIQDTALTKPAQAAAPAPAANLPPMPANLVEAGGKPELWPTYTPAAIDFFTKRAAALAAAKAKAQ